MKAFFKQALIPTIILIGMALCTISSSLLYWENLVITSHPSDINGEENVDIEEEPLYSMPLFDTYDSGGVSLSDFMSREGVLEDLISINNDLNSNKKFIYYQISEPTVYYVGEYKGNRNTIVGGEEYRNQLDNSGDKITSLNTLELSFDGYQRIWKPLKEGCSFSQEDFNLTYENKIPVIVGHDYNGFLSVGDEFYVQYYMEPIKVEVIGILEEDAELHLPSLSMMIDGYMIFPNVEIVKERNDLYFHNTIMMLEKNEGYIGVRHLEDFPAVINEISEISDTYNFSYNVDTIKDKYKYIKEHESCPENVEIIENEDNSEIEVHNRLTSFQKNLLIMLLVLGTAIVLYGLFLWCKCIKKSSCFEERVVVYKTKRILEIVTTVTIVYFLTYITTLKLLENLYDEQFFKESLYYPQGIMRLILVLILISVSVLTCKIVDKKVKEDKND